MNCIETSSKNIPHESKNTGTMNSPTSLNDSPSNTQYSFSMKGKELDASQNTNSTTVSGILEGVLKDIPLDSNSKISLENKYAVPVSLGTAEVVNLDKIRDNVTTSPEGVDSNRILQTITSQDERSASIAIPITDQANSNHVSASSNPEMCPSKESIQPEGKCCQYIYIYINLYY